MKIEIDLPENRGSITRQFTVWCGMCGQPHTEQAMTIDGFCIHITNEKTGEWRLSRDHGWVHKSCLRLIPISLKFKNGANASAAV